MNTDFQKPRHVAIIMDGNGRWARRQMRPRVWGHHRGVERAREVIEAASEQGIEALTLFAFSEENWSRPVEEVGTIMGLLNTYIKRELDHLDRNDVRLRIIGNLKNVPQVTKDLLEQATQRLESNKGLKLTIALSYGARSEIVDACKEIAYKVLQGSLAPESIDHSVFESSLSTYGLPDVDLLIRTSGEYRVSNFLLWQIAYTELYFSDVYWPDFTKDHFIAALSDFSKRQRRFGGIVEDHTGTVQSINRVQRAIHSPIGSV